MGYAVVEFILGVAGLLFHVIFTMVIAFSYDTVFPNLGSAGLIDEYKWISGAMIILPQSILLGSTFPLLCSALIRREQQGLGKHISVLYFTNSIGAAAGALIATFLLIPEIGMPGAMLTSGMINIGIALVTYLVAKQPEEAIATGEQDIASEAEASVSKAKINKITMVALITAAITGAVSFMCEIACGCVAGSQCPRRRRLHGDRFAGVQRYLRLIEKTIYERNKAANIKLGG